MNRLPQSKREQILSLLVEGASLRATARILDVSYNAVLQYLPHVGRACAVYQDRIFRNLSSQLIQIDEIWSFVHTRRNNVTEEGRLLGRGDCWTFVALDPVSKIIPCWKVGARTYENAYAFIGDLYNRLASRIQLTSDGYRAYRQVVEEHFGDDIDYAMLIKIFDNNKTDPETLRLYDEVGIRPIRITGNPDPRFMSTSYIERSNLTMRQSMRRFTRKTTGFSKKVENHAHAVALNFFWYNFGRIHKTLRITPAMAAGFAHHVWEFSELVELINKSLMAEKAA